MIDRIDLPLVMPKAKIRRTKSEHLAELLKRRAAKKAVAVPQAPGLKPDARAKRAPGRPRTRPESKASRRQRIDDVEFADLWNDEGREACMRRWNLSLFQAQLRASRLRKNKGMHLVRGRPPKKISDAAFIAVATACRNAAEAAAKLNMTRGAVYTRMCILRRDDPTVVFHKPKKRGDK